MTVATVPLHVRRTADAAPGEDERPRPAFGVKVLAGGLLLYLAFGKGAAYAGIALPGAFPVFLGEAMLALVLASTLRPWAATPRNTPAMLSVALVGITAVQVVLDRLTESVPAIETLRGIAPVYYCAFAFATYALLRAYEAQGGRAAVMAAVDRVMVGAAPWLLAAVAFVVLVFAVAPDMVPSWPGFNVTVLSRKWGDRAITLTLVAPVLFGSRLRAGRTGRLVLIGAWAGLILLAASRSRGAMLAVLVGLAVMRPRPSRLLKGLFLVTTLVVLLYITGISIKVSARELSYETFQGAVESMIGGAPDDDIGTSFTDTKEWRTEWWNSIVEDVRREKMIVHGHGWGDNLAVRYGVISPLNADNPTVLRLPHNIAFSLVARAGIVVTLLFLAVPVLSVASTFRLPPGADGAHLVAGARGVVAAMVTLALTDIYLESPQGGIPFWIFIGFLWWCCAPSTAHGPEAEGASTRAAPRPAP